MASGMMVSISFVKSSYPTVLIFRMVPGPSNLHGICAKITSMSCKFFLRLITQLREPWDVAILLHSNRLTFSMRP